MANSCAGLDASIPDDIRDRVRTHVRKKKADKVAGYENRTHLDQDDGSPDDDPAKATQRACCLLEDLDGKRCDGNNCSYNGNGRKKDGFVQKDPL
jgi:hypothetical protein